MTIVTVDDICVIKCLCRDDCTYCNYTGHFIKGHCPQCGHPDVKVLNPLVKPDDKESKP